MANLLAQLAELQKQGKPVPDWYKEGDYETESGILNAAKRYGTAWGTGGVSELYKLGRDGGKKYVEGLGQSATALGNDVSEKLGMGGPGGAGGGGGDASAAQGYTQSQVDAGRGYIGQGTQQAAGALGQGAGRAQQFLGQGYDQAQNTMQGLYSGKALENFTGDPGYQFRLQQGQDALMHAASAQGGRHGGDTLKALAEYNQNFASNEFNNYANRQMGLGSQLAGLYTGQGQAQAGVANQYGQNMAGLYTGQGSQLAGLGMQGAQINAGLTQAAMGQPQQPSGTQQLLGLAGMAAGAYFGGPMGAQVGGQLGSQMGAGMGSQQPPPPGDGYSIDRYKPGIY